MSQNAIVVKDVDLVYRSGFWHKKTQTLHQVSFEVPVGSIFGFIGANGAGKTTLIQLIAGLRRPTAGQVLVFGSNADEKEAKRKIGYLPERPYFYTHLTGRALLEYFGILSGMSQDQIRSAIPKVLEIVHMTEAGEVKLGKYSKGMLQRIGIAQALLHDPQFLLLDEPMSGLDPMGRRDIRNLIRKLAKEGRTIFFSSHSIPDVKALCTDFAIIEKGKILRSGSHLPNPQDESKDGSDDAKATYDI